MEERKSTDSTFIVPWDLQLNMESPKNIVHHSINCAENINFAKHGTMGAISVPRSPAYNIQEKTGYAISFWMWFFLILFDLDVWKCEATEAVGEGEYV